jgi:hypothetical protein
MTDYEVLDVMKNPCLLNSRDIMNTGLGEIIRKEREKNGTTDRFFEIKFELDLDW